MGLCNSKLTLDENGLSLVLKDFGTNDHPRYLQRMNEMYKHRHEYTKADRQKIKFVMTLPDPNAREAPLRVAGGEEKSAE